MSEVHVHRVQPAWKKRALIDNETYLKWYRDSVRNPDKFWGQARASASTGSSRIPRSRTRTSARQGVDQLVRGRRHQRCLQLHRPASEEAGRPGGHHLGGRRPLRRQKITYRELYDACLPPGQRACKKRGVKKGDRVTIYMPMIPEAAYAMLACARIGAIHSVVFGGFSPDALAGRIDGLRNRSSSSPPTRACAAAGRSRSRTMPTRRSTSPAGGVESRRARGAPHRRADRPWCRAATSGITTRSAAQVDRRVPRGEDEGGGSALHPLHLRLDRQARRACCTPPAAIWSTRR